jgi:hypothetical protein
MRNSKARLLGILAAGAVLGAASNATAATISFSSIVATWSDVIGGTDVSFNGNGTDTASVFWGTSTGSGQSGYAFTGLFTPLDVTVPPSPTSDFAIGTFTHYNSPILAGTSIDGVRLTVGADVWLDGTLLGNYSFVYDVLHWETPNYGSPCADGGAQGAGVNLNGCADNVTTDYNALSDSFQHGSDFYTLDMRGFQLLDGTAALSFWTKESADNTAYLLARVNFTPGSTDTSTDTADIGINVIPEPSVIALMLTGLVSVGVFGRRQRQAP